MTAPRKFSLQKRLTSYLPGSTWAWYSTPMGDQASLIKRREELMAAPSIPERSIGRRLVLE